MTETTSTREGSGGLRKSFFGQYVKYGLSKNKTYLLASVICSVVPTIAYITLLYNISSSVPVSRALPPIVQLFNFLASAAIIGHYVLCITGGVRSFEYLNRANKTDTLMCLPLTGSQRFWGDLLTGYLTTAAPIIPCGAIGVAAVAVSLSTEKMQGEAVQFALVFSGTMFFVMTFAYLLSVLAASLCGNRAGGIITAVLFAVISMEIPFSWGGYFILNILGYPMYDDLAFQPQLLVPSYDLIGEFEGFINIIRFHSISSIKDFDMSGCSVSDPLNVVVYILLSLGLVAVSFLISKKRRCEHTGEVFAAKYSAVAVTVLALFTAAGVVSYWCFNTNFIATILTLVITCTAVCVAAELILRRGVKKLGKRVVVYAISTAATIGLSVLISVTRAFGMSYVLPGADKIESVEFTRNCSGEFTEYYRFDKESDIEIFRERHAQLLNERIGDLRKNLVGAYYYQNPIPDMVVIRYTLKNGGTFLRMYTPSRSFYGSDPQDKIIKQYQTAQALNALPCELSDYPAQYALPLDEEVLSNVEISLGGVFGTYRVYPEKITDFSEILRDDIVERYSQDSLPIGCAGLQWASGSHTLDILETYENTLAFIKDPSNAELISEAPFALSFSAAHGDGNFSISLTEKDMQSPAGKELAALMRRCHPSDVETLYSDDYLYGIKVVSPDYYEWFIPAENVERVVALLAEIVLERI